ncbi:hypothetical protein LPJ57_000739 [Coemansia sp. RSA 486]|nr:hypothetical protein LPJ57_000739 [Coemansia sp. RSA 486]
MNFSTPMLGSNPSTASAPSSLQLQQQHHPQHMVRYRHSCEHCRQARRKIKCSGSRPICDHCARRGIECIYKPLARARRTPTIAGSPAQHLAISGSLDQMFCGLTPPSPFAGSNSSNNNNNNNSAHPIPIPMSGGQLASAAYSQLSPYSIYQHPDPRYASAPHPATTPSGPALYGPPAGQMAVSGQSKHMRPANAIPQHLLETANMTSAMSPINTPQSPFSLTGFPPDLSALPGSFNSMQSDLSEIISPSSIQAARKAEVDIQTLYDIQIPPQQQAALNQGTASLSSLSTQSPGFSLGEYTARGGYLNEDGTLSMLSSTSQPTQSAFGDGRRRPASGHKRTLTQDSSDSLSNMPLLERASLEATAPPYMGEEAPRDKMSGAEFDQLLFSLSQGSMQAYPPSLSPEMPQQQQVDPRLVLANAAGPVDTGSSGCIDGDGDSGIAPELTMYSEQPRDSGTQPQHQHQHQQHQQKQAFHS